MPLCTICNKEVLNFNKIKISSGKTYHQKCYIKTNQINQNPIDSSLAEDVGTTKKCPFCAESILIDAKKCKHCKEFLSPSYQNNRISSPEKNPLIKTTNILLWILILIITVPILILFLSTCGLGLITLY